MLTPAQIERLNNDAIDMFLRLSGEFDVVANPDNSGYKPQNLPELTAQLPTRVREITTHLVEAQVVLLQFTNDPAFASVFRQLGQVFGVNSWSPPDVENPAAPESEQQLAVRRVVLDNIRSKIESLQQYDVVMGTACRINGKSYPKVEVNALRHTLEHLLNRVNVIVPTFVSEEPHLFRYTDAVPQLDLLLQTMDVLAPRLDGRNYYVNNFLTYMKADTAFRFYSRQILVNVERISGESAYTIWAKHCSEIEKCLSRTCWFATAEELEFQRARFSNDDEMDGHSVVEIEFSPYQGI